MLSTQWLRRVALLAVLAMLAVACGGDDTADPGADDPGDTPDETEPADDGADDDEGTETEGAGDGGDDATGDGDGVLTIGNVLPETGDLAFLGPPMIAGVEMAIQEINEEGGVLGEDVVQLAGDSGDGDGTVANQTVDRHLSDGADVIMGAAASGISLTIIDKVTGAGIVQFSPANTAITFTDYDDDGLYFRTAPPDSLQGPVLAETILDDGHSTLVIMARSDDYGRGLAEAVAQAYEEAGGTVLEQIIYDHEAQNFDSDVSAAGAANPEAIAVIGFDESARILQSMIENNLGPADIGVYGSDGNRSNDLAATVDPNNEAVLEGMRGTSPAAAATQEFIDRLMEFRSDLSDTLFAGESYDAMIVTALAAIAAGSDAPRDIADSMNDVTREGTTCTTFAECRDLLEAGDDIDYDGVTGPLDFTDAGEPGAGRYDIWEIDSSGAVNNVGSVDIAI